MLTSCTIITTTPNEVMVPIHDRMPVILRRQAEPVWLDYTREDASTLNELLVPYPAEDMKAYPVSTLVNSPSNDQPDVLARLG